MFETKKIVLPSNGKVNYKEITIRNMTGADEKLVYSNASEDSLDKLLKRCIVEPEDIVTSELCEQDKYYILMQIRILTFGSEYKFVTKCPECGVSMEVTIDLDELHVDFADDGFEDSLHYVLKNKDEDVANVQFKILTTKDVKEVNNYLAKLKLQNDRGAQYIMRLAAVIDTIDGEKKTLAEKQKFLEESNSKYLALLWNAYNKIRLGVDLTVVTTCPKCASTVEVGVIMNAEFFRPTIES